ncbi:MAG TPA: hypothetical protein VI356_07310 [Myxococcales bacterium]
MASTQLKDIAAALGLGRRSSGGTFYGELDGFPAQVSLVQKGNYKHLAAVLRFNAEGRAEDVSRALNEAPEMAAAGLKRKLVASDADSATITIPPRVFLGLPAVDVVTGRVRAVLEALKRAVPDNRKVCRECGAAGAEPALLRGKVDRVCGACAERLEQEAVEVRKAYAARPVNLPLGLVASLVAGAAGAVVYGGAMIATNKMYWVLAILTGVMVGWAAVKGAGKAGVVVQAMAGMVTLASVLAGLVVFIGWIVNQRVEAAGNHVDWTLFVRRTPQLLWDSGTDTLFSLAGGLLGAFYAIRKAAPPSFAVVEKAPEAGLQS